MYKTLRWFAASLLALILLAACGGGGGGGATPQPPPPPSPPPPPVSADTPLPITAANAESVARSGLELVENAMQIFIVAMELGKDLIDDDTLSTQLNCAAGGTATATVTDTDADTRVSVGDTISVDFAACFSEPSFGEVTGTVLLSLSEFTGTDAEPLLIRGGLSVSTPLTIELTDVNAGTSVTETLDGQFEFALNVYDFVDSMALSQIDGTEFTSIIDGKTDTVTNLFLARDGSARRYRFSFEADIESDRKEGAYRCATTADFIAAESGEMHCIGASASELRLVIRDSGTFADLSVDANGNGSFSDVVVNTGTNEDPTLSNYSQTTLTAIDTPRPFIVIPPLPVVQSRELVLSINGAIFDAASDRIYVTTDTGVSAIDHNTLTVVDSLALNTGPAAIAISDDGSTLWVGYNFMPEVLAIDAATLAPGTVVQLGSSAESPSVNRGAVDIEVAPNTTDTLVIGDLRGKEVYAVSGGAVLPDVVINFLGTARNIVFSSASELVGFNNNVGYQLELTATGVSQTKEVDGFGEGVSGGLAQDPVVVGPLVFNRVGRALDFLNNAIEGRILFDGAGNSAGIRDSAVFDAATNRLYYFQRVGTSVIEVFDATTLTAIGRYEVGGTFSGVFSLALANDGSLIILGTDRIRVVDATDLVPNISIEPCKTRDYSNVRASGSFYEIECRFEDLVYDTSRDLIYASVPGYERNGNSVAVIDPENGTIIDSIPVGSQPGRMSLSADESLLWVALTEASRVVAVDLNARSIATVVPFPLEPATFADAGAPLRPVEIAVSPAINTDIIVGFRFSVDVRLFSNGTLAPGASARGGGVPVNLEFLSDATRAVAYEVNRLDLLGVDASGVSLVSSQGSLVSGLHIKTLGDTVYSSEGQAFDTILLAEIDACDLPPENTQTSRRGMLALSAVREEVYFYRSLTGELVICDRNTFSVSAPAFVPNTATTGIKTLAMEEAGPDRLALATETKLFLFDPTALGSN